MPEIELKLAAEPGDLDQVRPLLRHLAGRDAPEPLLLHSTYFDTRDLQLHRAGLTLRVRDHGGRFVQTVKSGELAAPPLARGEWEDAIAGAQPELSAPQSGARLPAGLARVELRPLFATAVRRSSLTLSPGSSTEIEAVIDQGEILGGEGERKGSICEIELELKRGDPATLYDVGLRLLEAAPLRIEARSKAERGYDLLQVPDAAPRPQPSTAFVLDPAARVEDVLREFTGACLATILRNEAAALAGVPGGLHQMRVAARRLRALLTALKRMLPPAQYGWVRAELKWLAAALSPARNWDVLADSILSPVDSALLGAADLDRLARACREQRMIAHRQAETAIRSTRYTRTMMRLLRWCSARDWREQPLSPQSAALMAPVAAAAPNLLARRHRKVCAAVTDFAGLSLVERHRTRIAIKKLRYLVDLFEPIFDRKTVAKFVRRLKPLQAALGHANDVRTANLLFARLPDSGDRPAVDRAAGIVLGWHDRGLAEDEPRLRRKVRRFERTRPFW